MGEILAAAIVSAVLAVPLLLVFRATRKAKDKESVSGSVARIVLGVIIVASLALLLFA